MTGKKNMIPATYKHREAFCLMQYRDEVTGEVEVLWNSRDGVTPFGITSRSGNMSRHINFNQDRCVPNFVPEPGMRIFVDASPKHAHIQQAAKDYVERHWSVGMQSAFDGRSKEEVIEHFIQEWTRPGSPTVVEA